MAVFSFYESSSSSLLVEIQEAPRIGAANGNMKHDDDDEVAEKDGFSRRMKKREEEGEIKHDFMCHFAIIGFSYTI